MSDRSGATALYPPEGLVAPKDRVIASGEVHLPAGTEVFSADNHISLSEDIFYERFPESLKDKAPRVVYAENSHTITFGGPPILPKALTDVLMQYDPRPGSSTGGLEARAADLEADGIAKELAFPNALLVLMAFPDKELRELCFRIYNEYLAELQERSNGRFYGVGIINWWDGDGARKTLAEAKSLGLKTFWLPLKPGAGADGNPIDYNSKAMIPVWEAIEEAGLPVSHHIGESGLGSPCEDNIHLVGMLHNAAPFREMFGRYIFGGILDRHPGIQVGWFEAGLNWVPSALQEAEHLYASVRHMADHDIAHDVQWYWDNQMRASFMVDPLGLESIDRLGIERVMWSSDYPHMESTFGYSRQSVQAVVDVLGEDNAARVVSGNVKAYLGLDG
jgi:predicted TIM-barrel fold metal-dependent hydrolase